MDDNFEVDQELIAMFADGAQEMLDKVEDLMIALEKGAGDPEITDEVLRHLHTIKGNSGMVGFGKIRDLTHGMEEAVGSIKKRQMVPDPDTINQIITGVDCMRKMIANVRNGKDECVGVVAYESCLENIRRGR